MTRKQDHKIIFGTWLIVIFILASINSPAQNEASIWYFGNEAGLKFHGSSIVPVKGKLNTLEGCASIGDAKGNLLFYTDGITVYNKFHRVIENGNTLGGHYSATQSAIIVPAPGLESIYYIFTTDHEGGSKGLSYSMIDMKAKNGEGKVVRKNINLYPSISEKVTSIFHENQKDIWIITYDWNKGNILSFLVNEEGIKAPVISETDYKGGNRKDAIGQLTISSHGDKLAIARYGSSRIDVLEFDNTTGRIGSSILSTELTNAYGVAFSPSGKILYGASWIKGNKNYIYQYDLSGNGQKAELVAKADEELGQLQLAPNGQVIIARPGQKYLGSISNPEIPGKACNYKEEGIFLGGDASMPPFSSGGLPAFNQSYNIPPVFNKMKCNLTVDLGNDTTLCEGDILKVRLNDPKAQFIWNTGTTSSEIKITGSGKYWVNAKKGNCMASDTVKVNVIPGPEVKITYEKGAKENIILTALGNADHFEWDDNIFNNKKVISAPGNYRLIIKKDGCRTEKIIRIK